MGATSMPSPSPLRVLCQADPSTSLYLYSHQRSLIIPRWRLKCRDPTASAHPASVNRDPRMMRPALAHAISLFALTAFVANSGQNAFTQEPAAAPKWTEITLLSG